MLASKYKSFLFGIQKMASNSATTLTALDGMPIGGNARIAEIRGDHSLARRLMSLGLRVGSEVKIMQRRNKGIVVACSGNRVALGGSVANKLFALPLVDQGTAEEVVQVR